MKPAHYLAEFDRTDLDAIKFGPVPNASLPSTPLTGERLIQSVGCLRDGFFLGSITPEANGWIVCSSMDWHTDPDLGKWNVLLLVRGCVWVETREGSVMMRPGDMVILNTHEEHKCFPADCDPGWFLLHHFNKKPTRSEARAGIVLEMGNLH